MEEAGLDAEKALSEDSTMVDEATVETATVRDDSVLEGGNPAAGSSRGEAAAEAIAAESASDEPMVAESDVPPGSAGDLDAETPPGFGERTGLSPGDNPYSLEGNFDADDPGSWGDSIGVGPDGKPLEPETAFTPGDLIAALEPDRKAEWDEKLNFWLPEGAGITDAPMPDVGMFGSSLPDPGDFDYSDPRGTPSVTHAMPGADPYISQQSDPDGDAVGIHGSSPDSEESGDSGPYSGDSGPYDGGPDSDREREVQQDEAYVEGGGGGGGSLFGWVSNLFSGSSGGEGSGSGSDGGDGGSNTASGGEMLASMAAAEARGDESPSLEEAAPEIYKAAVESDPALQGNSDSAEINREILRQELGLSDGVDDPSWGSGTQSTPNPDTPEEAPEGLAVPLVGAPEGPRQVSTEGSLIQHQDPSDAETDIRAARDLVDKLANPLDPYIDPAGSEEGDLPDGMVLPGAGIEETNPFDSLVQPSGPEDDLVSPPTIDTGGTSSDMADDAPDEGVDLA